MSRLKKMLANRVEKQGALKKEDEHSDDESDHVLAPKPSFRAFAASSSEEDDDEVNESPCNGTDRPETGIESAAAARLDPPSCPEVPKGKATKKRSGKKKGKKGKGSTSCGVEDAERTAEWEEERRGKSESSRPLVGREVEVRGTSRSDLNGLRGRVIDFDPSKVRSNDFLCNAVF